MFVFVFEATLFKFKQEAPHNAALFQLPPTSATAPRKSVYFKPGSFYATWLLLFLYGTRYLCGAGRPVSPLAAMPQAVHKKGRRQCPCS